MKRLCSAVLVLTLLTGLLPAAGAVSSASAGDDYIELSRLCARSDNYVGSVQFTLGSTDMVVDGETRPIDPDQEGITPQTVNSRTLLPARALVESLGGDIAYEDGVVSITGGDGTCVELSGGEAVMRVDGREVLLDAPPMYVQNRTFLPVRAVSESLSCQVDWDPDTRQVTITQPCQSRRLLVQYDGLLPDTHPEDVLDLGGGARVLVYSTVADTAAALDTLERRGIPAWPDAPADASLQGSASAGWQDERCGLSDFARQGGDRSVTVAVIDSGLDSSPDLFRNRVTGGFDFLSGRAGVPADDFGHGTFVSGLIAAYTPENVHILPLKLFDEDGFCSYLSLFVAALRYAGDQGADLVNMSLSMPRNAAVDAAVRDLTARGVTVVCSAGNRGTSTALYSPAGVEEAVVVAATDVDDRPAAFTNRGSSVDLSAPGASISSVGRGGRTETRDGTSFSAPLAAAAGAVLLSRRDYAPAELEDALQDLTVPFPQSDSGCGVGILNLYSALEGPEPTPEPTPSPVVTPTPQPEPEPEPEPAAPVLRSYRWSLTSLQLRQGQSASVRLYARYSDGSEADVTQRAQLAAADPSVLSVSGGTVTGLSAGSTVLTFRLAAADGVTLPAPLPVTVLAGSVPVEKVVLSASLLNLTPGGRQTLIAVVSPQNADDSQVVWSTSDPSVATVSSGGVVTAVGAGDCQITAASGGRSALCNVRVTDYASDQFTIDVRSGPASVSNNGAAIFVLDVDTPIPYETGSHPLVLWCGLYAPGVTGGWVETGSRYYDGGSSAVTYILNTSDLDLPSGNYVVAFSLFYADRFYTGASLTDTLRTLSIT